MIIGFDSARKIYIEHYNKQVQVNREVLNKVIHFCLFLCNQQLTFPGDHESSASSHRGNFKKLLSLISQGDEN